MKKLLRLLMTISALGAAAYVLRNKLLPPPQPVAIPPPQFRRPTAPPVAAHVIDAEAVEAVGSAEPLADRGAEPVDDLKVVKGIGPVFEKRLNEVGITSLGGLVRSDAPTVSTQLEVSEAQVADWIRQARGLVY